MAQRSLRPKSLNQQYETDHPYHPALWARYDLSGRRLLGKATKPGLYINNDRKIAIK